MDCFYNVWVDIPILKAPATGFRSLIKLKSGRYCSQVRVGGNLQIQAIGRNVVPGEDLEIDKIGIRCQVKQVLSEAGFGALVAADVQNLINDISWMAAAQFAVLFDVMFLK